MHGELFHVKKNRRKLYKGEICMHFFLIIHAEVTILKSVILVLLEIQKYLHSGVEVDEIVNNIKCVA